MTWLSSFFEIRYLSNIIQNKDGFSIMKFITKEYFMYKFQLLTIQLMNCLSLGYQQTELFAPSINFTLFFWINLKMSAFTMMYGNFKSKMDTIVVKVLYQKSETLPFTLTVDVCFYQLLMKSFILCSETLLIHLENLMFLKRDSFQIVRYH